MRTPRRRGAARRALRIDLVTRRVTLREHQIDLSRREFALLCALATRARRRRDRFVVNVWGVGYALQRDRVKV